MKLGYIAMPDTDRSPTGRFTAHEQLALADSLDFKIAYVPCANPRDVVTSARPNGRIKIALDAKAFGALPPSEMEAAVRDTNDQLEGRLSLGVEMCDASASSQRKAQAQAFETMFSFDPRAEQVFAPSPFPMKPPRPDIIGLPVTGSSTEARLAAERGYSPMTPSWLADKDVARSWPAIVAGATSAVRRARPSQWQVNRMVVVHDDAQTRHAYIHGPNSPIRRHFTGLAERGLLPGGDIDAAIKRRVIAGSVRKVAEDILALREAVGTFGTLNIIDPVGGDVTMTRSTMMHLAHDVLPMVVASDVSHIKNLERT